MHYGGHLRSSFLDWLDDGCPAEAVVEINYEDVTVDWQWFMRRMARCSDILPGDTWREFRSEFLDDTDDEDGPECTYGSVARWLLANYDPEFAGASR